MTMHVTDLHGAEGATVIELPVDMKREFSRDFTNRWDDLVVAQFEFLDTVLDCLDRQYTTNRWQKVDRLFDDLTEAIRRGEAYASRLRDSTRSDPDNQERDILGVFLVDEGAPFLERWEEILLELDCGETVDIDRTSFWMPEDPDRNWKAFGGEPEWLDDPDIPMETAHHHTPFGVASVLA